MARARRNRPRVFAACICSVVLLAGLSACSMQDAQRSMRDMQRDLKKTLAKLTAKPPQPEEPAQPEPTEAAKPAKHAKAAEPVPEPTQQELAEYLRGKLLALSPNDGINDNVEVNFDPSTSTLTVVQPNSHCDQFLSSLDANNVSWDSFDPSDGQDSRNELLRLTVTSVSGKTARACFDVKGQTEAGASTNRVRLLFSLEKAEQVPGFKDKMAKTVKKLIVLSGGVEGKELFQDPHNKSRSNSRSGNN